MIEILIFLAACEDATHDRSKGAFAELLGGTTCPCTWKKCAANPLRHKAVIVAHSTVMYCSGVSDRKARILTPPWMRLSKESADERSLLHLNKEASAAKISYRIRELSTQQCARGRAASPQKFVLNAAAGDSKDVSLESPGSSITRESKDVVLSTSQYNHLPLLTMQFLWTHPFS